MYNCCDIIQHATLLSRQGLMSNRRLYEVLAILVVKDNAEHRFSQGCRSTSHFLKKSCWYLSLNELEICISETAILFPRVNQQHLGDDWFNKLQSLTLKAGSVCHGSHYNCIHIIVASKMVVFINRYNIYIMLTTDLFLKTCLWLPN